MMVKDYILNKLILESLLKNGTVTIEEAEFYNRMTDQVVTKIAKELITENEIIAAVQQRLPQAHNFSNTNTNNSIAAKLLK